MFGAEWGSNEPHDFSRVFQVGVLILSPVGGKVETGFGAKERRKSPCSMLPEWQLEVAAPSRMYCDRLKILRVSHVHKYAVQILHIKYVAEPGIRSMAAMTVKTL